MIEQAKIDLAQQQWIVDRARQAGGRILQVGCGQKPIMGAVNTDPNPGRLPWVNVQADTHALPFADGVFACVVSSHVVPALADPVAAFREMARVLQGGGEMAHVIPDLRFAPARKSHRHRWEYQPHGWLGPADFWPVAYAVRDVFAVVELAKFEEFDWSFKFRAVHRVICGAVDHCPVLGACLFHGMPHAPDAGCTSELCNWYRRHGRRVRVECEPT